MFAALVDDPAPLGNDAFMKTMDSAVMRKSQEVADVYAAYVEELEKLYPIVGLSEKS